MIVAALGDSVTAGVGDSPGPQRGWAAHLARALDAREFRNLARIGARTSDLINEQLHEACALGPDLTTVLIGGNDVLRTGFDPAWIGRQLREVCGSLPGIKVVVLLPNPQLVLTRPKVVSRALGRRSAALNEAVERQLGGVRQTLLIDPSQYAHMHARSAWHVDRMHPSAQGHRLLAAHAVGRLEDLGLSQVREIQTPTIYGSRLGDAWWCVSKGVPWFLKRSVDFLPELVSACWQEHHHASGPSSLIGELVGHPMGASGHGQSATR